MVRRAIIRVKPRGAAIGLLIHDKEATAMIRA